MEKKLKALLVDDEQHCLDTLKFDINRFCSEWLSIVGEAKNVISATSLLNSEKPDILFLDIDLPGMNGLDFLESLGNLDAKIIFTTAHSKYAIPAYKFKAEAFLLKPINSEELKELIELIHKEFITHSKSFTQGKLTINDMHGTTFISHSEIIACESNDNYCKIYLKNGELKTVSKTLKFIEEAIKSDLFLRIHQSYLVNTQYIKKYLKRDGGSVEMINNKIFPVSKGYKERVYNYLHS